MSSVNAIAITYDYLGNNFNRFATTDPLTNNLVESNTLPSNIGPRITGSVTFANGINNPVTSYFLSDGLNTLNSSMEGVGLAFNMIFNNTDVSQWVIALTDNSDFTGDPSVQLVTVNFLNLVMDETFYSRSQDVDIQDKADLLDSPGTWTLRDEQISEVPVSAALPLMASALGIFGLARRRNKSKTA